MAAERHTDMQSATEDPIDGQRDIVGRHHTHRRIAQLPQNSAIGNLSNVQFAVFECGPKQSREIAGSGRVQIQLHDVGGDLFARQQFGRDSVSSIPSTRTHHVGYIQQQTGTHPIRHVEGAETAGVEYRIQFIERIAELTRGRCIDAVQIHIRRFANDDASWHVSRNAARHTFDESI